jgi:hypothetical protein
MAKRSLKLKHFLLLTFSLTEILALEGRPATLQRINGQMILE